MVLDSSKSPRYFRRAQGYNWQRVLAIASVAVALTTVAHSAWRSSGGGGACIDLAGPGDSLVSVHQRV